MKLSEQLLIDHECGVFGNALEGYSERADKLERALHKCYYFEACENGAGHMEATAYAKKRVDEIN